jgi:hypothetical protein
MSKTGGRGSSWCASSRRSQAEPSSGTDNLREPLPAPTPGAPLRLTKADIERHLTDFAETVDQAGISVTIELFGGAAMALAHYDRPPTNDVDGSIRPAELVLKMAADFGRARGLPDDWLNNKAAVQLLPQDRPPATPIIERGRVTISLAAPETLLAMKLRACRPRKDFYDLAYLLRRCDVRSVEEAIEHLDQYYSDEELSPRDQALVEAALGEVVVPTDPPVTLPPVTPRPAPTTCRKYVLSEDGRCNLPLNHKGSCSTTNS